MPRSGRPKAELTLTDDERAALQRWARRRKSAQALALRSRIVLACAEGLDNKQVATRERVTQQTVGKWRGGRGAGGGAGGEVGQGAGRLGGAAPGGAVRRPRTGSAAVGHRRAG